MDNSTAKTFSENSTRIGPNAPDKHYVSHIYDVPGNYVAALTVGNLFEIKQTDLDKPVVVQNSLSDKFLLKPAEIKPVPYPPGLVIFNSSLMQSDPHSSETIPLLGWANDVHVKWFQVKSESTKSLLESYGKHDVGKCFKCLLSKSITLFLG